MNQKSSTVRNADGIHTKHYFLVPMVWSITGIVLTVDGWGGKTMTKEQRERLSKLQRTLFKLIGNIESVKLLMTDSEGPCEAPCYPICCDDCPFGELGVDIDDN